MDNVEWFPRNHVIKEWEIRDCIMIRYFGISHWEPGFKLYMRQASVDDKSNMNKFGKKM